MASHKLMTAKDGRKYYRIYVYRGRGNSYYTTRWYVPEGWSKSAIERKLKNVAEHDEQCSIFEGKQQRIDELRAA